MAERTDDERAAVKFPPGQDPNDPAFTRLTEAQTIALRELAAGKPVAEAAAAGVDRSTLYRWRTMDDDLIEAMGDWRQETRVHCRDRMLAIADKAIRAVETGLEKGDARLAFRFLLDLHRKTPQEQKEDQRREQERRIRSESTESKRLAPHLGRCSVDQLKNFPELIGQMVDLDNARLNLAPGEYIVIEHRSPIGAFKFRSDGAPAENAPADGTPAGDAWADDASDDDAPFENE